MPTARPEEIMVPGEIRWINIIDGHHADAMRVARQAPFCGMLAQPLISYECESALVGSVFPLVQLQSVRRPDRANTLVEVVCVGRGVAQCIRPHGPHCTSSLEILCDEDDLDEEMMSACAATGQELRELHDHCLTAAAQFNALHPSSISTSDIFADFPTMALTDMIKDRRNTLSRRRIDRLEVVPPPACSIDSASDGDEVRPSSANEYEELMLLSYVACAFLEPAARRDAVESTDTQVRLQMCMDALRERYGRMMAALALCKT